MPEIIEAEVIEIDGHKPAAVRSAGHSPSPDKPTSAGSKILGGFGGKVIQLDRRWWPLWVILGVIAIAALLVFGTISGALYVAFLIVRGIVRALAAPFRA